MSTGEDVWYLKVRGQLVNESWSNIGITWEPLDASAPLGQGGGLEVTIITRLKPMR